MCIVYMSATLPLEFTYNKFDTKNYIEILRNNLQQSTILD